MRIALAAIGLAVAPVPVLAVSYVLLVVYRAESTVPKVRGFACVAMATLILPWFIPLLRLRRRSPRAARGLAVALLVAVVLAVTVPLALWRVPSGPPVRIEGEVRDQVIDHALDGRAFFETLLGRRRVHLVDGGMDGLWLTAGEWRSCLRPLRVERRAARVVLEARPLRVGGLGPARVVSLRPLEKKAVRTK